MYKGGKKKFEMVLKSVNGIKKYKIDKLIRRKCRKIKPKREFLCSFFLRFA